jgi:2,5-diketo-D-gluconate reductase A
VGDGIRDAQARGVAREEIFLTTKIFPESYGYGATIAWFDRVLGELGLDYIDLVLMHAPRRWFNLYGSEETEFSSFECKTATRCRQETWKALSELRARGKIREVGVSNFRSYHIEPLLEAEGSAPVAVNQIFYHPWIPEYQKEVVEYCNKHGIALTGYFSLGGAFAAEQTQSMAQIKAIAAKHKKSSAQVLLRWSLQNNVSIIPGTGNPKHMRENLDVYGFDLSADEMAEIGRIGEANPMPNLAFPEFMNK